MNDKKSEDSQQILSKMPEWFRVLRKGYLDSTKQKKTGNRNDRLPDNKTV
jgi:hypothetical protein